MHKKLLCYYHENFSIEKKEYLASIIRALQIYCRSKTGKMDSDKTLESSENVARKDLGLGINSIIDQKCKNEDSSFCSIKDGDLKRTFSIWSILGIGFGLTNSWWGVSAGLVAGIQSGGPMMIVYGVIIIACVSTCVGITLSEMSSAIPSAGGQYVWTRVLSPKKYSGFLAYLCGSFAWAGAEFMSASITLSIAEEIMAFWILMHPDFEIKKWHNFLIFQLMNIFLFIFNCHGRFLPTFAKCAIYVSLFSFIVTGITVVVCARGHYNHPVMFLPNSKTTLDGPILV